MLTVNIRIFGLRRRLYFRTYTYIICQYMYHCSKIKYTIFTVKIYLYDNDIFLSVQI